MKDELYIVNFEDGDIETYKGIDEVEEAIQEDIRCGNDPDNIIIYKGVEVDWSWGARIRIRD